MLFFRFRTIIHLLRFFFRLIDAGFLHPIFDVALFFQLGFFCFLALQDKRFKFIGRNRLGEEVTLDDLTAQRLQGIQLALGFHALGDDRNVEEIGDVDDDFQHAGTATRLESVADKIDIQLHRIDRHRRDHM